MTDTLSLMAATLPNASREVRDRIDHYRVAELTSELATLGVPASVRAEVASQWDQLRRDDRMSAVLAQVIASTDAARGRPDSPIAVWDDLHGVAPAGDLFYFYVMAMCAPATRSYLHSSGVPESVIESTLASVHRHTGIYRQKWGTTGIDAGWWQLVVLRGELLEIGSLQYHNVTTGVGSLSAQPWYGAKDADARGPGFRRGDSQIGLHIPSGARFDPVALDESLRQARTILHRVWPTTQRRLATCASWLLDDQLAGYLPATSHILAFQRRFTMAPGGHDDDGDILEFVFRRPGASLDDVPQSTTLERAIVALIRAGGHWMSRAGWFDFDGTDAEALLDNDGART